MVVFHVSTFILLLHNLAGGFLFSVIIQTDTSNAPQ